MALLPGVSEDVLRANVAELIRRGMLPGAAVVFAQKLALSHRRDAKKKKKLPRKLPVQVYPKTIETSYAQGLIRLIIAKLRRAYAPLLKRVKAKIRDASERQDAVDPDVKKLLAQGAKELGDSLSRPALAALAQKFAEQTSAFQRQQLRKQVHGVLGANPAIADTGLGQKIHDFVKTNVSLVTRIPEDLHDDLADLIEEGAANAWTTEALSDRIEERFGVAERHARLIARDQIGGLYADVNHDRQQELGVTKFIWRTVHDERVRGDPEGKYPKALPSHFDLDGLMFSYDDPPEPEGADGPIMPGDEIQCRCYAEPVLEDLIGSGGDDEEDPEELQDDADTEQDPDREDSVPRNDFIQKRGKKYVILNHTKEKVLGSYPSERQAEKRLRQIEYFKNRKDWIVWDRRPSVPKLIATCSRTDGLRISNKSAFRALMLTGPRRKPDPDRFEVWSRRKP